MEKSQQNKSPSSLTFIHVNLRAPSPQEKKGLIRVLLRDTDGYPLGSRYKWSDMEPL